MNANELMIGDWVECVDSTHKKKVYAQIDAIEEGQTCILVRLDNRNWFLDISFIKPIPLTPEILEKNGFKYYHKNFCSLSYDHPFKLEMTQWPDENGLGGLWTICGIIEIRFVHQIQQAMSLCGIEKEIVL